MTAKATAPLMPFTGVLGEEFLTLKFLIVPFPRVNSPSIQELGLCQVSIQVVSTAPC